MELEEGEGGGGGKIRAVIEKATNSTAREVDPRILKAIKSVVRYSDFEIRVAVQTLMDLMKREHSQVRYLTLLVIDELFMRSKLFRTLLVEALDKFLSLSVGFRRNLPLPAPPSVASLLRSKAIEVLEKWNASFGVHYRQLRVGFDYLKNTLRLQFPNHQANAARIQQERTERAMRTKEITRNKYETLRENFSPIKEEIKATIDEIAECLDIVQNKDDNMLLDPLDDEDLEEFRSHELRQIRIDALKEGEKVRENSENEVVFDALREQYKILVTKHLVSVQEWVTVLVRVELEDNRFRDSTLKEFIDIRNSILAIKKKCEESGCAVTKPVRHGNKEEAEEDFWEEGGSIENENSITTSITPATRGKDVSVASSSSEVKNRKHDSCSLDSKPMESVGSQSARTDFDLTSQRGRLLAEAPVLNWDHHLDNWGSNREVLANQRGMDLETHWGRVDYDAVIPAEKIAEMNLRATLYQEDEVEIQPCRAPLRRGGLCQRRDLKVCPFHGPIIPRDNEGKPVVDDNSSTKDTNSDFGSETTLDVGSDFNADQLGKQAVKNVRDRDKEEANKKIVAKQLKRAKVAKVKEHNETVLRTAGLASTSRSAVFDDVDSGLVGRNKKGALASMLRKKVTAKDRLAQKLLNTRVSARTTRQLALADDAKFREAFPSQS